MAYSEKMAERIRQALANLTATEEKKMFGGLAFMVNGHMCITTSNNHIMCRIGPKNYDAAIKKEGCSQVIMKGREYKGYVRVSELSLKTKADLAYWIKLALEFNKTLPKK